MKNERKMSIKDLNKWDDLLRKRKGAILRTRKRAIWGIGIFTLASFATGIFWGLGMIAGGWFFSSGATMVIAFFAFTYMNDQLIKVNTRRREIKQKKRLIKVDQ